MNKELSGKVVLITGAAKNIGRATALAFAADGAAVAVNALSSKAEGESLVKEIQDAGGKAALFLADIADGAAVKAMVDGVVAKFGRLDDLVLNASYRKETPFLEMSYEQWRHVMALSLDGAFHCAQQCLPHMLKAGGGNIVMLGGAGALGGAAKRVNGSVVKHGMVGMTRALAKEFAPQIRVNMVSPGPIATVKAAHRQHLTPASNVPLGRQGYPEEIAAMVHFLCTSKGAFITGQVMHVNGGVLMGN
jgi:3-oxoacyl-[acyl-carrier protein] reductase